MYLLDVIKQRLKKLALPLLSCRYYIYGCVINDKPLALTIEVANKIVSQYSVIPPPFPCAFKRLSPTTIDLSIVIPVYNGEKFLAKCLTSILTQKTGFSFEVICVNDGSKDGSLKILSEFQKIWGESKVVILNQKNKGIAAARNIGIEVAKGEYIGFMDNDDTVTDEYVDNLLKSAKEHNADIVNVGYSCVDINGIEHLRYLKNNVVADNAYIISELCSGYIWSGIYKKSLWERVRFPAGYWYEDMITRLLIMRIAKIYVMIAKPLYCKLMHSDNASIKLWNAANPKSIESFYLAKYCADYGVECLGLENDKILMKQLIYEYSAQLRSRISNLPIDCQKAIFYLAAHDICKRFRHNLLEGNKLYTKLYITFKDYHFKKWKYYSRALGLASN